MHISVQMKSKRAEVVKVDVSFCKPLPRPYREAFINELSRFAHAYNSQTAVYGVRRILRYWFKQKDIYELPSRTGEHQFTLIKNLRRDYFEIEFGRGKKLVTINNEWMNFINFMERISAAGLFKDLPWESKAISQLPSGKVRVSADNVKTLYDQSIQSSKRNIEADSFHNDLLEPISIHLSDEDYLNEYANRLSAATSAFKECALKEIYELNHLFKIGKKCKTEALYKNLKRCLKNNSDCSEVRMVGRGKSLRRFFCDNNKDNFILENILCVIKHEMNGYPKPALSQIGSNKNRILHKNGPGYWRDTLYIGKNKLLPYLGVLTSETIVAFVVFLLIDNPSINVESLCNAKIYDEDGKIILLQSAGESTEKLRIRVDKPRSGSEKFSVASEETASVLNILIEMTDNVRRRLVSEGKSDEASYLLVGGCNTDYWYGRITPRSIRQSFKTENTKKGSSRKVMSTRKVSFLDRHEELTAWRASATLRSLRVSKGVLEWMLSGGNPVQAAQSLGHRNINITINNYLPKQIQNLIYQRQIRIHQNRLIVAACIGTEYLLEATDFNCESELTSFIDSVFDEESDSFPLAGNIKDGFSNEAMEYAEEKLQNNGRLLIKNDPKLFAIAIVYREYLRSKVPEKNITKVRKFWSDFIDTALGDLPDSLIDLRLLAQSSKEIADDLLKSGLNIFESMGLNP